MTGSVDLRIHAASRQRSLLAMGGRRPFAKSTVEPSMQSVYQLDPTRLLPGDVVLEAGEGLYSRVIRLSDGGRYSHVVLYLGANFIVEAVEEGVRIMQALRVVTFKPEAYLVLRHPEIEQLRDRTDDLASFIEQRLFASLLSELNKPYSWTGVLGTKLPFFRRRSHEHFCSQLVAESFRRIGIPIFSKEIPPDRVTPRMFDTDFCLLREVKGCFVRLPDSEWLQPFAMDRHKVQKSGSVPILELGSQIARDAVREFGPRVETAARRIGGSPTVGSLHDLYQALRQPDLPDADRISDELVAWMELRYPSGEIRRFAATTRRALEEIARSGDRQLLAVAVKTLQVDTASIERALPILESRRPSAASDPPTSRSIHRWLEKKRAETISFERAMLAWRAAFIRKHGDGARGSE